MQAHVLKREIREGQGGVWTHMEATPNWCSACEHASNSKLPPSSAYWLGSVHVHSIRSCWSPLSLSDVDCAARPGGDAGRSGRSEGNETIHVQNKS